MCLIITKRFTAKKPIFCYKTLCRDGENLITPYQRVRIPCNELYKDPKYDPCKNNIIKYLNHFQYVDKGYIHAYRNNPTSLLSLRYLGYPVFRAIIPVGSVGFYGQNHDICSNQIIILNSHLPGYEELCTEYGLDPYSNKFP